MPRERFLDELYDEKLKHKEHRHEFVKLKLLFVIGMSGIGSLPNHALIDLSILLYFIPFVALAYDVYIFSEDFKVKRIGLYIRSVPELKAEEDAAWERWLCAKSERREKSSMIASLVLTIVTLFSSSYLLSLRSDGATGFVHVWWLISCAVSIVVVFGFAFYRRDRLLRS